MISERHGQWHFDRQSKCRIILWKKKKYFNTEHVFILWRVHTIWCPLSLLKPFDCTLRVSGSLVLQADQNLLLLRVKTASVIWQPGQSGSSSPWAPDRPAESHDGWALSISCLHLWPVPDYSWCLFYSLLNSALHAPLTPHSPRELLELSHCAVMA